MWHFFMLEIIWNENFYFLKTHQKFFYQSSAEAFRLVMPNIRDPSNCKRLLFYGVVQSVMIYSFPIWCTVLKYKYCRKLMISAKRITMQRAICAYRTISAAIQVLAGWLADVPPIDLLVLERTESYGRKHSESEVLQISAREDILTKWQMIWKYESTDAKYTE